MALSHQAKLAEHDARLDTFGTELHSVRTELRETNTKIDAGFAEMRRSLQAKPTNWVGIGVLLVGTIGLLYTHLALVVSPIKDRQARIEAQILPLNGMREKVEHNYPRVHELSEEVDAAKEQVAVVMDRTEFLKQWLWDVDNTGSRLRKNAKLGNPDEATQARN
jgi:hypothetical protein